MEHRLYVQSGPDWEEVEIRGWWKDRLFVPVSDYGGGYLMELDRRELKSKRYTQHNGRAYFTPDGKEKEDAENARTIAAGQMAEEMYVYFRGYPDDWEKQRVFNMNERWIFVYWDEDDLEYIERKGLDSDEGAFGWANGEKFFSEAAMRAEVKREEEHKRKAGWILAEDALALGITTNATEAQVIAAFRKLAKVHHPDTGGTAEAFQRISAAKDRALATLRMWAKAA